MERIREDSETVTMRLTRAEFSILHAILLMFTQYVEDDKIDFERLMESKEDTRKFLAAFNPNFEIEV